MIGAKNKFAQIRPIRVIRVLFLLSLFLSSGITVFSQGQNSGYTFCNWEDITVKEVYMQTKEDTAIILVSCRNYLPGTEKFLDYDFDTTNTLHYFNIFFNHNKWICVRRNNMQEAIVGADTNKDAVVYAEGLGKTFCNDVDRATRLARTYDVLPIMFDWPTSRPYMKSGRNMITTMSVSADVAKPFSNFIKEIGILRNQNKTEIKQFTLFLHSMGNLLMMHAIEKKYLDTIKIFDNVILNAACVPEKNHKTWTEKIKIQKNLFITRNNHDRSLNGAKILMWAAQLGERPRQPFAKNALYISFNKVLHLEHNYFLFTDVLQKHQNIKEIYSFIFHGKALPLNDEQKFKQLKPKNSVELVKPVDPTNGNVRFSLRIG